jgi:hypothetical protein
VNVETKMSNGDVRRAEELLNGFVGDKVDSLESSKYQLRIMFARGTEFVVSSPWRVSLDGTPLMGSGDGDGGYATKALDSIKGLGVISTSVSPSWDTRISFEKDYTLEVIADSVLYETWEAHLEAGWVIFVGGNITLFPPATRAENRQATNVNVYGAGGYSVAPETAQAVEHILQGVDGLRSVGIATPSQTGCVRRSHGQDAAFDIVELNGTPVSWLTEHPQENTLLKRVQLTASQRGARESYGPAGIFQNGSQVMIPELQSRFTRHLHIGLGNGDREFK